MADKTKTSEAKLILQREYIVPLRRQWLKVAKYKRANRAVKELKKFIARNMKLYDSDLRKIKIENSLNNEIRFRGMRKPPAKIKVLAKKFDNHTIRLELVNIPEHVKFARLREEKLKEKIETKKEEDKSEKPAEEKKEDKKEKAKPEEKIETKEREEASKEENLKLAKEKAKEQKHISKDKKVVIHRRALSR